MDKLAPGFSPAPFFRPEDQKPIKTEKRAQPEKTVPGSHKLSPSPPSLSLSHFLLSDLRSSDLRFFCVDLRPTYLRKPAGNVPKKN